MDVAGLPSTLVCAQRQNITASRIPGQAKPQLAVIHLMMHRLDAEFQRLIVRQFSHGDSSFLSDQYKPGIDL